MARERPVTARRRGWLVYMLRCADGSLYTGVTNDLERRLEAHSTGRGARYTRSRLPVRLTWQEPARGRSGALRREAALKRMTRAAKLDLIADKAATFGRPLSRRRSPRRE